MARILVVADDLTGANATGARFARAGLRVVTVTPEHVAQVLDDYDVVVANTDSRHLPPDQAADLVTDVIEAIWPVQLVVKRTDSTLRGNIGAEIEAAWRAVRERTPAHIRVRALFVPAFPSSGRVTADGVQLLDGVPLERTELALDPLSPMRTSVVNDILADQSDLAVRHLPIRQVTRPLLAADLAAGNEPVVLCDALTEWHLNDIAGAAAEAHRKDGTVWLSVDPGPTGALLAEALRLHGRATAAGPLLAVVGSATELTRRQMDTVVRTGAARCIDIDVARFGQDDDYRDEIAALLADRLTTGLFPDVVVLRTITPALDVLALPAGARRALPGRMAELVGEAIREAADSAGPAGVPSGLFTSGGDVTAAVLEELDVHAFTVGGEIAPLVVHGTLNGGPLNGAPVVTKGGLVGDDTTIVDCLDRLRRMAQARLRQVHAEVSEHVMLFGGGLPDH